jgi:hypothetical protein
MNIGEPQRITTITPLREPIPEREPRPEEEPHWIPQEEPVHEPART